MQNDKIQKALAHLADKYYGEWCSNYGEPGYSQPVKGVILCDWNNVPKGLADWLEKCGYSLEWADEWMIDYDHGKAYRTSADSYSWEPSIMLPVDSCEYLTPDDNVNEWIDACQLTANNQPVQCLPSWINADDITANGFELDQGDFENGFFPGQNDEPAKIARALFERGAYRVLFQKSENSQFYMRFRVWADFDSTNS